MERITVEGTARTGAGGALVVRADGSAVYVAGLERWEPALEGRQVSVTGTMRRLAGDPVVHERGQHAHGFPGERLVLEQATWRAPDAR